MEASVTYELDLTTHAIWRVTRLKGKSDLIDRKVVACFNEESERMLLVQYLESGAQILVTGNK